MVARELETDVCDREVDRKGVGRGRLRVGVEVKVGASAVSIIVTTCRPHADHIGVRYQRYRCLAIKKKEEENTQRQPDCRNYSTPSECRAYPNATKEALTSPVLSPGNIVHVRASFDPDGLPVDVDLDGPP